MNGGTIQDGQKPGKYFWLSIHCALYAERQQPMWIISFRIKATSACSGINPTGRRSAIRAIREKLPARTWAAGKILAGRGRGVKNQHLQRKSTAAQNLRKRVFISGGRVILWKK